MFEKHEKLYNRNQGTLLCRKKPVGKPVGTEFNGFFGVPGGEDIIKFEDIS